ncbi:MAG TPA: hypothetical protein VG368_03865 [Acidimicrobiales bacterium]|jgi:hypothetical protein|nr:hypothetical protein [Acidimicrobiales bacterium]
MSRLDVGLDRQLQRWSENAIAAAHSGRDWQISVELATILTATGEDGLDDVCDEWLRRLGVPSEVDVSSTAADVFVKSQSDRYGMSPTVLDVTLKMLEGPIPTRGRADGWQFMESGQRIQALVLVAQVLASVESPSPD